MPCAQQFTQPGGVVVRSRPCCKNVTRPYKLVQTSRVWAPRGKPPRGLGRSISHARVMQSPNHARVNSHARRQDPFQCSDLQRQCESGAPSKQAHETTTPLAQSATERTCACPTRRPSSCPSYDHSRSRQITAECTMCDVSTDMFQSSGASERRPATATSTAAAARAVH